MATTGTVYVDNSLKGNKGVLVVGRVLVGNNATIDAQSFDLRSVQAVQFDPMFQRRAMVAGSIGSLVGKNYRRSWASMIGSVGSLGVLGNYVRVRTYVHESRGSLTAISGGVNGTDGRLYIGTQAGSVRASYIAWGI